MQSSMRFDPETLPRIGGQVRINTGQFEDYTGTITRLDANTREVYFTISVFDRSVELALDFDTAADILDVQSLGHAEDGR